jgi:hypothetical protein
MGSRLANGLRRRGHWLGMLGGGEGQVNESEGMCVSDVEIYTLQIDLLDDDVGIIRIIASMETPCGM